MMAASRLSLVQWRYRGELVHVSSTDYSSPPSLSWHPTLADGDRMQFDPLRRRDFITLLGGAAAAWTSPRSTLAQAVDKRPRRIAYLSGGSSGGTDQVVTAFLDGMHAHGYVEGRDFEIDYRFPEGHLERVSALAREPGRC
jgi:hypothetical protein